ncbi:hypothetical protein [Romboutsia lituseburensis]|nr:hypothetical protein [Romboutsia lituseburensis]
MGKNASDLKKEIIQNVDLIDDIKIIQFINIYVKSIINKKREG